MQIEIHVGLRQKLPFKKVDRICDMTLFDELLNRNALERFNFGSTNKLITLIPHQVSSYTVHILHICILPLGFGGLPDDIIFYCCEAILPEVIKEIATTSSNRSLL